VTQLAICHLGGCWSGNH